MGIGSSKFRIPPPSLIATLELFAATGFMKVKLEAADFLRPSNDPEKRGIVTHFSDASRRRMTDLLAKVDHSQIPLQPPLEATGSRRSMAEAAGHFSGRCFLMHSTHCVWHAQTPN
jgi:hypothetical protein